MFDVNLITWMIAIFGAVTFIPLLIAQLIMIIKPDSQQSRDMIVGKNKGWRDKSHYRYSLAFAWADWIVISPLFISGTIGVISGYLWGYIIWLILGTIAIYFSIIFWILEKNYSISSYGRLAYYTYFWGFFLYWGIAAIIFSISQIIWY